MHGKYKIILIAVILFILLGVLVGLRLWYKPHADIKGANATHVSAVMLYNKFTVDSTAADRLYKEKILLVSGTVNQVFLNKENHQVILLKTDINNGYVNCTMEENTPNPAIGEMISIKGLCSGYNGEQDLGLAGDVIMVRCYNKN